MQLVRLFHVRGREAILMLFFFYCFPSFIGSIFFSHNIVYDFSQEAVFKWCKELLRDYDVIKPILNYKYFILRHTCMLKDGSSSSQRNILKNKMLKTSHSFFYILSRYCYASALTVINPHFQYLEM